MRSWRGMRRGRVRRMEGGMSSRKALPGLRVWRMQRVASIDANPRTFDQRAATFAASVPGSGDVTLLVSRTQAHGIVSQLIAPARFGDSGAVALAQAVGARAVPVSRDRDGIRGGDGDGLVEAGYGIVLPETVAVGWLERDPGAPLAHSVQAGANPAEVARLLAGSLGPGQWAALVLRAPRNSERKAWRRWLVHRMGTPNPVHHSLGSKPLVMSVLAGGDDQAAVTSLLDLLVASLPGFDLGTRVKVGTMPWIRLNGTATVAAAVACLVAVPVLTVLRPTLQGLLASGAGLIPGLQVSVLDVVSRVPGWLPMLASAFAVLLGCVTVLRLRGHGSSWAVTVARSTRGVFPRPRVAGRVRPPRSEQHADQDGNGYRPASEGDYPLHKAAFLVGPQVVAAVVAPQSGALAGSDGTRDRGVPPVVLGDIGPVIGSSAPAGPGQSGSAAGAGPVHLSAFDAGFGVAITGGPGTGKTKLMGGLWLASALDRARPCGRPGWPGRRHTMVTFDTKGDEVAVIRRWAALADDRVDVVSVTDPSSLAIDMFTLGPDRHPDPVQAAAMFVDAMVYAFEANSIMARSQETLTAVFAGALVADPAVCAAVAELGPVRHPVRLAHVLCGGAGETLAKELFGAIRSEAVRRQDPTMAAAVEKLKVIFEPFTSSAFRNSTEAARNKLDALMKLRSWWDEDRPRIGWDEIVTSHHNVIIDTGAGGSAPDAGLVDERSGHLLAGMLMFGLWTALKRTCSGWRDQQRWVSVFTDELAVQAAHSAEPIGWMRDQGRSYGIRLCFATQRAEQLPQAVRDVFLTFPNLITFRQESVAAAKSVAENVSQGEDIFTGDDIRNLAPYTAVARLDVDRRLVPSFVFAVHNFEADPEATVSMLGFTPAAPSGVTPDEPRDSATAGWADAGDVDVPAAAVPVAPTGMPSQAGSVFDDHGAGVEL